jgi:hypothetical protein
VVLKLFWFSAHCKIYKNVLPSFGYKIKNILIYLYLVNEGNPNSYRYDVENCIKMDKAKLFAADLATSCGAPFENQWFNPLQLYGNLRQCKIHRLKELRRKYQCPWLPCKKYHENPFSDSKIVTCGLTDKQGEANRRIFATFHYEDAKVYSSLVENFNFSCHYIYVVRNPGLQRDLRWRPPCASKCGPVGGRWGPATCHVWKL